MSPMLKDKVAVVTGGSRGIGRANVLALAKEGCHVAFNYLASAQKAQELKKEVEACGVKCLASQVDVRDLDAVKKWIDEVKGELGGLDILINNAGIIRDKALMMMTSEDWQEVIDTNLTGMFNVSRSCIVTFLKQKSGRIINISSVSGLIGLPRQVNYSAAKGGMNAFTKALAKETAAYGVTVNAVAPGFIETDILSGLSEDQRAEINKTVPLGRIGDTDDVAKSVLFLLSPLADYITGQIITVDGGLAIR